MPAKKESTLTVRRIFIGSPGDLADERKLFPDIIERVNRNKAGAMGIHLKAVAWEDTLPGTGRPQAKINEDLKTCDLAVLVLWKRWGTPTGKYSSGFEEEYELARSEKIETFLYFKSVPSDMMGDPGPHLSQVLAFRKKIEKKGTLLFKLYENLSQWRESVEEHLCEWLDGPKLKAELPAVTDSEPSHIENLAREIEEHKDKESKAAAELTEEALKRADEGQLTRAEELFLVALETSPDAYVLDSYGRYLAHVGLLQKAEEVFTRLLKTAMSSGDAGLCVIAVGNLRLLCPTPGDLKRAEKMHKKSLARERALGHKEGMASQYGNLGNIYETRGDLNRAEEMYRRAMVIHEKLGHKVGMASDYGNLGSIHATRGDLKRAEEMYEKALELFTSLGNKDKIRTCKNLLARLKMTKSSGPKKTRKKPA